MDQAIQMSEGKYQELLGRYPNVITKRSILVALGDEDRMKLWRETIARIDKLEGNFDGVIQRKMKEAHERVYFKSKVGVGSMWRIRFYINNFDCELEVKKFTNGKNTDSAKYYAWNSLDSQCYIRDLLNLEVVEKD